MNANIPNLLNLIPPLSARPAKIHIRLPKAVKAKFRPCIDIHQGKVKQIVGSTLKDSTKTKTPSTDLVTNFVSDQPPEYFANLYKNDGLTGGHLIMLGPDRANRQAAEAAIQAWPNGMQVGGGINSDNARDFLDAGASHVIITSYVFTNGRLDQHRLERLVNQVGRERIVLDLSCRWRDGHYWVVTDRWQKFSELAIDKSTLEALADSCDEILVHGVDVEGKKCGIDEHLIEILGEFCPISVTYAGGVRNLDDLDRVDIAGRGRVDVTVGSALDIFGGDLPYKDVVKWHNRK